MLKLSSTKNEDIIFLNTVGVMFIAVWKCDEWILGL